MKRTEWLQETRKMRFVGAYEGYRRGSLTQSEAALLLGGYVIAHSGATWIGMTRGDGSITGQATCAGIAAAGTGG